MIAVVGAFPTASSAADTPPVISDTAVLPTTVAAGSSVTFTWNITSEDPITDVAAAVRNPSGTPICSGGTLTSGTTTDGDYQLVCPIQNGVPAGTWSTTVVATDSLDNQTFADGPNFTVQGLVSSITPSVNPTSSVVGQSVLYSATVNGGGPTPTGTVRFAIGGTTICTTPALSAGTASCSATNAPVGENETVTATYSGSADYDPSIGTTTLTIIPASTPVTHGYRLVGSDGGIFTFGSAQFYGSTGALKLQRPVVGISPTTGEDGYWLVASDGGVFAYNAPFVGSLPGLGLHPAASGLPNSLNKPIVGIVPSASGQGYYMVASDGGVFAFNANFFGSCPGIGGCSGSVVAAAPDASGNGYWLATATGNIYSFGDAPYFGGPGPQTSPITSMVRTPSGKGYWIVDANGQVFSYGDAVSLGGPTGSVGGFNPATAIFATSDGGGYWVASAEGSVYNYGDAPADGSTAGTRLNGSIIAGTGY